MYELRITMPGMVQVLRQIDSLKGVVENRKDEVAIGALNGAADVFERNFQGEGNMVGGWAALAERTVRERESRGFGGEHPIMIRYGDLKRIAVDSLMTVKRPTTFAATDSDGKTIQVSLSGNNGKLIVSASGEKAVNQIGHQSSNLPARPYWFVSGDVQRMARDGAVKRLADEIRKAL
jgi:hypothetical protein